MRNDEVLTTGLKVQQSVLQMDGELRSVVVDHLLEELAIVFTGHTERLQDLSAKYMYMYNYTY